MLAVATPGARIHREPHQIEVFVPGVRPEELMIVLSRQLMVVASDEVPLKVPLPPEATLHTTSMRELPEGTLICVPLASPCGDPLW